MISQAIKSAFFLALVAVASSCSAKSYNLVSHADFGTETDAGDLMGTLNVYLNTNGLPFPSIQIPVANPKKASEIFGQVSITNGGAVTQVEVKVDLAMLAHIQGANSSAMPNGGTIPITGLSSSTVMSFPIGGGASRVYLGISSGKLVLAGVALVVSEFDKLANIGLPLNVFYPFKINNLNGSAGIFTGIGAGSSGIAAFAGTAVALPASNTLNAMVASNSLSGLMQAKVSTVAEKASFLDLRPSNDEGQKIENTTDTIKKANKVLHISH